MVEPPHPRGGRELGQRLRGDDAVAGAAGKAGARSPPPEVWLLILSFVARWELGGTNEQQGPSREAALHSALTTVEASLESTVSLRGVTFFWFFSPDVRCPVCSS